MNEKKARSLKEKVIKHAPWLIIVLGAVLRIWDLNAESLRLDEAQSVWQASHSLEFIRTYMLKNVHLPLHNSLLHIWMRVFGASEVSVRALAVIPGILSVWAMYLLSKQFLKKEWAIAATFIAAISPFWIWYSREIRMYSLLMLVTILSYYLFMRIMKERRGGLYVGYTLVNLVGIYTHYFFFLVLFVQALFFFVTWKSNEKREYKKMLVRFLLVACVLMLAFAPWVYGLTQHYGSGTLAPTFVKPPSFVMFLSFFEFLFGYQPDEVTSALIAFWPLLILLGFVFLAKRKVLTRETYLLIAGVLIPIVIVFIVSQIYIPMFLSRYLSIVTPFALILMVWFVSELKGNVRTFCGVVFLALIVFALINQYTDPNVPTRENYRDAVRFLEFETRERDVIVISPPYLLYPFLYYYRGATQVTTMPIWNKKKGGIPELTTEKLTEDANRIKENHKRIFLLVGIDLDGALKTKGYFDEHLTKILKKQLSRNLWVHVYKAEYDNEPAEPVPVSATP